MAPPPCQLLTVCAACPVRPACENPRCAREGTDRADSTWSAADEPPLSSTTPALPGPPAGRRSGGRRLRRHRAARRTVRTLMVGCRELVHTRHEVDIEVAHRQAIAPGTVRRGPRVEQLC